MSTGQSLERRLGTTDAVLIGLGSMMGSGLFVAFAPAAGAAGTGLLAGLAIAGAVAYCNATSSAQLAAQYPRSGGTYIYGRGQLGPWPGFLAGWAFVIGKTASCAAMALAFAAYTAPPGFERPMAAAAVIVLAAVNYRGITRTALLTRIIVGIVLAAVVVALWALWAGYDGGASTTAAVASGAGPAGSPASVHGILQSAGILFFAFAGYARIATMAEEVRNPARTIPRAIGIALGIVLVLYAFSAVSLLAALGPAGLAASTAPWADAVEASGWTWASIVVRVGAAAACLGALLALLTGVGRTVLAMARERDLPHGLAAVHPRFAVPHRAEVVLAVVVCLLVLSIDLRGAIGFSSFGVLLYYCIANVSALTQTGGHRRYPRFLQVLGGAGCLLLAASLPWQSIAGGAAVLAVGVGGRALRIGRERRGGGHLAGS